MKKGGYPQDILPVKISCVYFNKYIDPVNPIFVTPNICRLPTCLTRGQVLNLQLAGRKIQLKSPPTEEKNA